MSLVFYTLPISNFAAKVEIVLRLKGLPFEALPPPGGYGSAEYKAIVGAGTIPALVDGDLVLTESAVIAEYLDEARPDPPLLPEGARARARVRQLASFHDTRLEPPLRSLFAQMAPGARDRKAVAHGLGLFRSRLSDLAGMATPQPWLAGPSLTLADAAYPPTLLMGRLMLEHLGERLDVPPALAAWQERSAAHPAVAPVLEAQEQATRAWLASKV